MLLFSLIHNKASDLPHYVSFKSHVLNTIHNHNKSDNSKNKSNLDEEKVLKGIITKYSTFRI